ncbi:MAG: hypothetical protein QNI84_16150 [Henriciella sp.]|nr:hypothetical protein [Henriciella sp.]
MNQDLQIVLARFAKLGEMSESEARRIVDDVYSDGIVSRGEAEALFRLNELLSESDPLWDARFEEAIKDFLLTREPPQGWVTDEEADWLLGQVSQDGETPTLREIDLLLNVLRYAEGAPLSLSRFALQAVAERIKANGQANSDMVDRMRRVLSAPAGEDNVWISQYEARVLFETNDSIAFAKNHISWNDMFARAIGNHLMARSHPDPVTEADALSREQWLEQSSGGVAGVFGRMVASFADGSWFQKITYDGRKAAKARMAANDAALRQAEKVTSEEHGWLIRQIGGDDKISPAERALLDFLAREAPGFAHGLTIAA